MTKVTGWDNGLSQDYDKGLGRWFANRLGARQQLRQDFEMKQHITQDAIRAAGGIIHRDGNIFFTNIEKLNAAIQWDRDQRAKELPVLPPQCEALPKLGESRWDGYERWAKGYGQQCAAQARELALMDAIKQVTILYEKDDYPVLTEICNLIATAK